MVIDSAASVFAPLTVDAFIRDFLEKEVLHLPREDGRLVEGIFDLDSMAHCLRFMKPQAHDSIRVIPRGEGGEITAQALQAMKASDDSGLGYLGGEFAQGSTVTFNAAEEYWPPVAGIARDLKESLASDVKCNVYCTPPESQGFDTHVDAHDVLVLQTSGSKTWRIHDVQEELPVESSPIAAEMFPRLSGSSPDYGEPTREIVLHPGDLLYLPRGVPHSAASTTEHSIHLTIGLYPIRTHEFIGKLIDLVAFADVRLRRRVDVAKLRGEVPMDSAGDILREIADICDELDEPVDVSRLMAATNEENQVGQSTRGFFKSMIEAEKMDLDTLVEWPEGAHWSSRRTPHDFRVQCGGSMAIPLKLEPVLGFFEANRAFRVGDAPDLLKDSAKVTLCRNLVKQGLLRITGRSGSVARTSDPGRKPEIPDWLSPSEV